MYNILSVCIIYICMYSYVCVCAVCVCVCVRECECVCACMYVCPYIACILLAFIILV